MALIRSLDPRTLIPNPINPRRTAPPKAMDDQLLASIQAIGIIQPPRVKEIDGTFVIIAGNRRTRAAIAANLKQIDVIVCDEDAAADPMRSLSENLIRASMNSVDIWRATENLEAQGWNDQAIADALALPPRTIKRLKQLAHLNSGMLDVIAAGNMPSDDQLRIIAAADKTEQAEVWKKMKPKKGQDLYWHEIARALSKRRIPFAMAKFGEDLAASYGIVWNDDLFAPQGEDGRYTTDVDAFFGAQQEWLQANLPPKGTVLPTDEYGRATLPKKAEAVYGKPQKSDKIGHYLDQRSGEVKIIAYREQPKTKPATTGTSDETDAGPAALAKTVRPDVTQKGDAMIGDLRTDALHQALQQHDIDPNKMIGLLVLAFAGDNVSVQSGTSIGAFDRNAIGTTITADGLLTADAELINTAARAMLTAVLSCRTNSTNSGVVARVAGEAVSASAFLPNMATEDFLSCLSKPGVERTAAEAGVRIGDRAKDTRANFIARFKSDGFVYPAARFALTAKELAAEAEKAAKRLTWTNGARHSSQHDDGDDKEPGDDRGDSDGIPANDDRHASPDIDDNEQPRAQDGLAEAAD